MMARTMHPNRLARLQSRANSLSVQVGEISRGRLYRAISAGTGTIYTMARGRYGWTCDCDGYYNTGGCKHLGAVANRAESEDWDFGPIA
jgi:hypothetical protein